MTQSPDLLFDQPEKWPAASYWFFFHFYHLRLLFSYFKMKAYMTYHPISYCVSVCHILFTIQDKFFYLFNSTILWLRVNKDLRYCCLEWESHVSSDWVVDPFKSQVFFSFFALTELKSNCHLINNHNYCHDRSQNWGHITWREFKSLFHSHALIDVNKVIFGFSFVELKNMSSESCLIILKFIFINGNRS